MADHKTERRADPTQGPAEGAADAATAAHEATAEAAAKAEATARAEAQAETGLEPQGPEAEAEAPAEADPELRLAELEAERDELKKQLMYALAETENVRKRAERDRREAADFGGTRLARDLLSVHDNLERALDHADDRLRAEAEGFLNGVELTHRELLNAFSKHRIEKVTPEKGEAFDPNRHQAMFEAPVPGAKPGTVIEVMQSGFTIAGRLLRPAMVGVARAAPEGGEG